MLLSAVAYLLCWHLDLVREVPKAAEDASLKDIARWRVTRILLSVKRVQWEELQEQAHSACFGIPQRRVHINALVCVLQNPFMGLQAST